MTHADVPPAMTSVAAPRFKREAEVQPVSIRLRTGQFPARTAIARGRLRPASKARLRCRFQNSQTAFLCSATLSPADSVISPKTSLAAAHPRRREFLFCPQSSVSET
jgi:hypothetical protein